jgi:hypothetical protein
MTHWYIDIWVAYMNRVSLFIYARYHGCLQAPSSLSCRRDQERSRIMRRNGNRMGATERARNILTSPHIMHLVCPAAQPRDIGKCKCLFRGAVASVDNEDVHAFGRITGIVFRGRSCWGFGCRFEWSGWTANSAVLMECK